MPWLELSGLNGHHDPAGDYVSDGLCTEQSQEVDVNSIQLSITVNSARCRYWYAVHGSRSEPLDYENIASSYMI